MAKKKNNTLIIIIAVIAIFLLAKNAGLMSLYFRETVGDEGTVVFDGMTVKYKAVDALGVFVNSPPTCWETTEISGGESLHTYTYRKAASGVSSYGCQMSMETNLAEIDIRKVDQIDFDINIYMTGQYDPQGCGQSTFIVFIDQGLQHDLLYTVTTPCLIWGNVITITDFSIVNDGSTYSLVQDAQVLGSINIREGEIPHTISFVSKALGPRWASKVIFDLYGLQVISGEPSYLIPINIDLLYDDPVPLINKQGVNLIGGDPFTARITRCTPEINKGCLKTITEEGLWYDNGNRLISVTESPVETLDLDYIYREYPSLTSMIESGEAKEVIIIIKGRDNDNDEYRYYDSYELSTSIPEEEGTRIESTDLPSYTLNSMESTMHEFIFNIEGMVDGSVGRFEMGLEALPSGETIPIRVAYEVEVIKE